MAFHLHYPFVQEIYYLILLFIIFSIAGWIMEVALKYIQFHRFINRGFLIGPYCPIYGTGAVLVISVVYLVAGPDAGYFEVFLISFFFCGALEYIVSWYMEKLFHARWWDYSEKPMNVEGRIWIGNLVLFGIGGIFIVKWIAPLLFRIFDRLPFPLLRVICICFLVILAADYIISYIVTNMVKRVGEFSKSDSTEEISKEIRRILSNTSILHRRIMDAYPNMQARTKRIQMRISAERHRLYQQVKEQRKRFYRK